MFQISIETHFSAAHRLRGYDGDCSRIHGHNWKVKVQVETESLDDLGMGIDFRVLRRYTEEIIQRLDHENINEVEPFDRINPSSENLAVFLFEQLKERLRDQRVRVKSVEVWESERYSVRYSEDAG